MDKKKLTKKDYWKIAGLILLIVIVFSLMLKLSQKSKDFEDYKNCIDSCISENDLCINEDIQSNIEDYGYVKNPNAEDCLWGLEFCVGSCQIYEKII